MESGIAVVECPSLKLSHHFHRLNSLPVFLLPPWPALLSFLLKSIPSICSILSLSLYYRTNYVLCPLVIC